jgi:hypothetical protein
MRINFRELPRTTGDFAGRSQFRERRMTIWTQIRKAGIAAALVATPLLTAPAAGAATYLFSYSGPGVTASGTLTTSGVAVPGNPYPCGSCNIGPHEVVTGITGTRNGNAITGLLALGALYGNNNNIYTGGPYLDWGDLGFSSNGINYNVFQGNYAGRPGYFEANSNEACCYTHPVDFTLGGPGGVPEPAAWALMLAGFGLTGVTLRRRKLALAAA